MVECGGLENRCLSQDRGFESLTLRKLAPDSQAVGKSSDRFRTIMPRYKLVKMYDAGGDIEKEWFVKYHYLKPIELQKPNEPLYERFKIGKTINEIHTLKERRARLRIVHKAIKKLLDMGYSPYHEFKMNNHIEYSGYLLSNCIDEYLKNVKPDLKINTYRKYEGRLKLFKEHLKSIGLETVMIFDIRKDQVFTFLKKYQVERDWSNKTYNHYLQALHTFFEYYISNYDGYIDKNPCEKIKRLQVTKVGNRPFDNYEFPKTLELLKVRNTYLYQFSRFIYYSCLRPDAELRKLQIWEIDLISRRLGVPGMNSKGKITQWVPIDDNLADIISEMELDKYPRDYYVFGKNGAPGPGPVHEKYFGKYFRPIKKELKLHPLVNLYSFKHTRAIHLVEDGEKLHNIIKLTRHKTLAELMDYLKDMGVIVGDEVKLSTLR